MAMATTAKKTTKKNTKETSGSGFTAAELAAMKARAEELRASGRGGAKKAAEAEACLAAIEQMTEPDRGLAQRIHTIVTTAAPALDPKTWYGMPAYARDGKVVCFFKPAAKFGSRYATFGFEDAAMLDEGTMWTTSFAITGLGPAHEKQLADLVERAAG
jgi:uncharacterized protein YdhG (YjbR/CyaY superfamily)